MEYAREARTIDYTRKQGLLHEEFNIPEDAPKWLRNLIADRSVSEASEAFWNKVEVFEKRADAQLAKDVTIALPTELSAAENIELVRNFVARHITPRGIIADWVYHEAPGNPHIHLMMTLRPLTEVGFGGKKIAVRDPDGHPMRNEVGKLIYRLWAGDGADFNAFRDSWFACQNRHLALAGLDIHVDGRSFEKQGIALEPTIHLGVGTAAIRRKVDAAKKVGIAAEVKLGRIELQEERREINASRIERDPGLVIDVITREKSVFDERDVAKLLHRYIDDPALFRDLLARVLQHPAALCLDRGRISFATGARSLAKYTTRDLVRIEAQMADRAIWLARQRSHRVSGKLLKRTLRRRQFLSDEQKTAIEHVAGGVRISAIVGRAGAGKTTMMQAAREAWEAAGYRVLGGALAGKAAEGLEKEAGMVSRTLSSWELCWNRERDRLDAKTVFVLDEAGMVSSRQLARFVEAVAQSGAKLVLVGDPDQLQPIEAGAAFRAIVERIGYAELETIYRQSEQWMRDASLDLARGNVSAALSAYEREDMVRTAWTKDEAIASLIGDWDRDYDPQKTSLILAHRRRDVRILNEMARARLTERGQLDNGCVFQTEDGARLFAAGEQIIFLKNEGSLGVKNGMLARVVEARPGHLVAKIGNGEDCRQITIDQQFYANVDHGYATTIHKSQGATVDRVKVLASSTMDRHLTYVAMTRHRDTAELYIGLEDFARRRGGVLIGHGEAPFEHRPENRDSYFITIGYGDGEERTIWGVDLPRAMDEAGVVVGDRIGLEHVKATPIKLPDGTTVERNSWKVVPMVDLAMARMCDQLSRDASKETTLDYRRASDLREALRFAETRGFHLLNVGRTLVRDRLHWTIRQKKKLTDLASRLATIGARLGLGPRLSGERQRHVGTNIEKRSSCVPEEEIKPLVSGISAFEKSLEQAVEAKVSADPVLKNQWQDVSARFHLVFAEPQSAFDAVNVDAMIGNSATAAATLGKIVERPEAFGKLKGRTGLFAGKAEAEARRTALVNLQALVRDLDAYLHKRGEAVQKYEVEVRAARMKAATEIPALSDAARQTLERVRGAIDRNDLPAGLKYALSDKTVKSELEGFARIATERFGERAFLPLAAKTAEGKTFEKLSAGMNAAQKSELRSAWNMIRTVQQLAAHERTTVALSQAEAARQTRAKGLSLK